jgi:hypothetical protein
LLATARFLQRIARGGEVIGSLPDLHARVRASPKHIALATVALGSVKLVCRQRPLSRHGDTPCSF